MESKLVTTPQGGGGTIRKVMSLAGPAVLLWLVTLAAPAAAAASTLGGAQAEAFWAGGGKGFTLITAVDCNPSGVSTFTFVVDAPPPDYPEFTATGPYPGPFSETITVTIGPQTVNNGLLRGELAGPVQSMNAVFTIDSPDGQVMGTKEFSGAPNAYGVCRDYVNEQLPSGLGGGTGTGYFVSATGTYAYGAEIQTSSAVLQDSGTVSLLVEESFVDRGSSSSQGGYLNAAFTSSGFSQSAQTITFPAIPDQALGDGPLTLDATASSGLPVSYATSGECDLNANGKVRLLAAGGCTVTASQGGNANWLRADDVSRTFSIAKGDQAITFPTISDKTYGDGPLTLDATTNSGLPVSYATAGDCDLNTNNKLRLLAAGSCTVTASQAGDANWRAANDKSRTLAIAPALLTIGAGDKTKVTGEANPAFTVSYAGFVMDEGPGALSGVLDCMTTAAKDSPVGSYPISCGGLNSPNYAITWVDGTLSVKFAPPGECSDGPGHRVLQPIDASGTSVFKHGRTVPVRFRVCDADGNSIGGPPPVVERFRLVSSQTGTATEELDELPESTTPDTEFRWSPDERQWIFNLGTTNRAANKTYHYRIILVDGSTMEFQFGLR